MIIGVAKAGTTSLWNYLKQHPGVYMSPINETNYFAYEGEGTKTFSGQQAYNQFPITTQRRYLDLFRNAQGASAIGEVSPIYLESVVAAERIRDALPRVRLFAVLRQPVDRAVSDYKMWRRKDRGLADLERAFGTDQHVVRVGLYYDKLKRYSDRFPRKQLRVELFEDLRRDPRGFVRALYDYVGADPGFEPDVEVRHNVGGFPKRPGLQSLLVKIRQNTVLQRAAPAWSRGLFRLVQKRNIGPDFELPEPLRRRLLEFYREDILRVGDLIGRDLSHWLRV